MSKSNKKSDRRLKICLVILVVFALIIGSLVGINLWEKHLAEKNKIVTDISALDTSMEYNGQKYDLKEDIETLLVLGLDKYESPDEDSYNNDKQADFLMLLVIDNKNQKCTALHINRDSMAQVDVLGVAGNKVDTVYQQIALAHTYGNGQEVSCRNTADAVSRLLLNVEIDHYVSVTMDAVPVFNDFVGGVEVEVLDDFNGIDDTLVKGETVTLTGEHALNYVRTRYGLDDSSNDHRMIRQRQYLEALLSKTQDKAENDEQFIVNAASKLSPYIVSDCSGNRLQELMKKVSGYELTEICALEGENLKGDKFMEFYPDTRCVEETVVKLFYTPGES